MIKKYSLSLTALTMLGLTSTASAALNTHPNDKDTCRPSQPAVCYPDDCPPCQRCLGPENFAGNPPVCPQGCNGDWEVTVVGCYWRAYQDGMEYAIDTQVTNPNAVNLDAAGLTFAQAILQLNQLAEAKYHAPHAKWDWGFKLGLGYCSPCDGWDLNLLWTWYHGRATDEIEADVNQNHTVLPIWSAFVPSQGSILYATNGEADWKLHLNLVDLELGRDFWVSRHLAIRPFIGLRYASIRQRSEISYMGGAWSAQPASATNTITGADQSAYNGRVDLENNYRGPGLRAGLDSAWNFGCGWAVYGNFAVSLIYGKFSLNHEEWIRLASLSPRTSTNILDDEESFRAARSIIDLALGIQWSTMFCNCKYGFKAMLGWEQHTFFDQNQMWRVSRVGSSVSPFNLAPGTPAIPALNNTGSNVIQQRRGSLDTQGWTLAFKLDY